MKQGQAVAPGDKCPDLDSFLETLLGHVKVAVFRIPRSNWEGGHVLNLGQKTKVDI